MKNNVGGLLDAEYRLQRKIFRAHAEISKDHCSPKIFQQWLQKESAVFQDGDLEKFVGEKDLCTPYWLVRKVVMILAFFGGLRHTEVNIIDIVL